MKYAMLSYLIPKELENDFRKNSKHNMQDAANALQWNIINGLYENLGEYIKLFNVLPVDSFPQYYKYPWIKKSKFEVNGINIGFCNIKLIRNYLLPHKIYKVLNKWCKSDDSKKVLFVYTISQPFMKAVTTIKKKYPDLVVCPIVADLPDMASLSVNKGLFKRLFIKSQSRGSYDTLSCANGFVLLTRHMAEYMKISQPFCVMEGIAPDCSSSYSPENKQSVKSIMYSGTLHRRFGVLHLIEAFSKIPDADYSLIICGVGDSEDEIMQYAQRDVRIKFLGQLKREEVIKMQKSAMVLVNPRMNNEEFTKYSFPSKTLEYLASGIPAVVYKLDGIPDEYDVYLNYPDDDSPEALAEALVKVCSYSDDKRREMGNCAKEYVSAYKNKTVQCKRIIDFVESLF